MAKTLRPPTELTFAIDTMYCNSWPSDSSDQFAIRCRSSSGVSACNKTKTTLYRRRICANAISLVRIKMHFRPNTATKSHSATFESARRPPPLVVRQISPKSYRKSTPEIHREKSGSAARKKTFHKISSTVHQANGPAPRSTDTHIRGVQLSVQ